MALPENPITRKELYYSVLAGQNTTDSLPESTPTDARELQYLDYIARNSSSGVTKDYVDNAVNALDDAKVDKVEGKELSTNDYTDTEKTKLAGLSNYDDTALSGRVTAIESVVPSAATAQNKLSTVADVANEEVSSSTSGTSTTVNDSADARVQGLTIKGRSHKSKNLLEITAESQTINGVTFTVDKVAGTITANGTSTGTSNIYFRLTGLVDSPAGTYHLSGCVAIDGVTLYNDGHGLNDTGEGSETTFDTETSYAIFIRIFPNTTLTNAIFRPMLCTATDYAADPTFEPYGIHSVGDDGLAVQTTGKNLLNSALFRQGEPNNPGYHANIRISSPPIPVKVGDIYTFSNNYTFDDLIIGIYVFDESFNILQKISEYLGAETAKYKGVKTFTISAAGLLYIIPGKWINDNWGNVTVSEIQATNPQLELGSTATAYEPYRSTSADYTTGLPLCFIPDTTIHDELNAGKEVVKQCGVVELDDLAFTYANNLFSATVAGAAAGAALCEKYTYKAITSALSELANGEFTMYSDSGTVKAYINDTNYSDAATFTTAVAGVKLIYPLATPTTTPLTDAEISAFRQLRTFDSTTNINITDEPEYSIDYLKNTDNGEAVSRVVDDLQSQINDKIVVSGTLTLTAAGWSNGAQTVSFAHDTSKRNVIDITPSEIPKWAQYGVYAVSETSAGITFNCASTPNEALTFKVTSMEVIV